MIKRAFALLIILGMVPSTSFALRVVVDGSYADEGGKELGTCHGAVDTTGPTIEGVVSLTGAQKITDAKIRGVIDFETRTISFGFDQDERRTGVFQGRLVDGRAEGKFVLDGTRGTWSGSWIPETGFAAPEMAPVNDEDIAALAAQDEQGIPADEDLMIDPNDPYGACALLKSKRVERQMTENGRRSLSRYCGTTAEQESSSSWSGSIIAWFGQALRGTATLLPSPPDVSAQGFQANTRVNNLTGTFPNITQNEVSVAASGSSTAVVAAYNDATQPGFSLVAYSTSTSGQSWTARGAVPPPVGGQNGTDPVVVSDRSLGSNRGKFYLARIASSPSNGQFVGVSISTDTTGVVFQTPVKASPGSFGDDKPDLAVDPTNGNVYVCWTEFTSKPRIAFSRSTNGGTNWASPTYLTLSDSRVSAFAGVQGCSIAAEGGRVYVGWAQSRTSSIELVRSTDAGATFGNAPCCDPGALSTGQVCGATPLCTILGTARPPDFAEALCPDRNLNGAIGNRPFAYLSTDALLASRVYAVWDDFDGVSGGNHTSEIRFSASTDGGVTWQGNPTVPGSLPVRLNDTATNDQFQPRIATQRSGDTPPKSEIRVIWYDRRRDVSNFNFDLYYTTSLDAGATWQANSRLNDTTNPEPLQRLYHNFDCTWPDCYFGDYIGFASYPTVTGDFVATWGDMRDTATGTPCHAGYSSTSPDPNIYSAVGC